MKDFLDRTYYPAEGKANDLPYAMYVCALIRVRRHLSQLQSSAG